MNSLGLALVVAVLVYLPFAYIFDKLNLFTPKSVKAIAKAKMAGRSTVGTIAESSRYSRYDIQYEYTVDGRRYTSIVRDPGVVIPKEITVYWSAGNPSKSYNEMEVVDGFVARFLCIVPVILLVVVYGVLGFCFHLW